MRVMTFNLRFENDRDGKDGWSMRRQMVTDVIERCGPLFLGTQEGTPAQLAFLNGNLPAYGMVSAERPDDPTCQYPTLFYRLDRVELLSFGEFWLSRTPNVHRSVDWDSAFPRMMNFGHFRELETGREVWVAVTHLDHMGRVGRLEQGRIIAQWVQACSAPVILTGDFNDSPDSSVYRLLTGSEVGLVDSWVELGLPEGEVSMTHHDFHGVPQKWRMDWVLASRELRAVDARIVRDHLDGRYPSDHFPFFADLVWR
jgi:endonuclease/exonuclease/phosphatase family metal-dependent hydrolase